MNGTAFNNQPTYGNNTLARGLEYGSNYKGDWWIGTYENRSSPSEPFGGQQGDGPQGSLTSPSFQITGKLLTFLIGAGCRGYTGPNIRAELIVDGEVVRNKTTKECDEAMTEKSWNVTGYAGKNAQLRLVDISQGPGVTSVLITYKLAFNLFQTRILEFPWLTIKLEKLCKMKNTVRTTSKFLFLISNPPLHKFFDLILQLVRIYSSLR